MLKQPIFLSKSQNPQINHILRQVRKLRAQFRIFFLSGFNNKKDGKGIIHTNILESAYARGKNHTLRIKKKKTQFFSLVDGMIKFLNLVPNNNKTLIFVIKPKNQSKCFTWLTLTMANPTPNRVLHD